MCYNSVGGGCVSENKNSPSRIRANNKYNAKAYDRINIAVPKGRKAAIQALAQVQGESLNSFVVMAIDERIERLQGVQGNAEPERIHMPGVSAIQPAPSGSIGKI